MATRELYMEMRIPLNGDMFDDAGRIGALKSLLSSFDRSAESAFGAGNYTIHSRIKTYRSKADAVASHNAIGTEADTVNSSVSETGNEA